ncbi:MAG: hypothetical protein ACR2RV_26500, partial [Verrucomicrobiales bacterium]
RPILFAGIALIACASPAFAQGQGQTQPQQNNNQATSNKGEDEIQEELDKTRKFFQVSLSDGGSYMVALSRITSIAKHEYVVDGAVRVNEVSITAEGATITRFYYLEELSNSSPSSAGKVIIDRVRGTTKEVAKRTGTEDLLNAVSKSYPDGTHTHNIEYRLRNKANVAQLYNSLHDAWYNGRGKRVSVRVKE